MGGWGPRCVGFASLAHRTRPIKVEQLGTDWIKITWNHPVWFGLYGIDTNIEIHSVVGGWTPHVVYLDSADNWSTHSNDHLTYDRWRIVGDPVSLDTGPQGFKYPIGGPIPYDRPWDP